MFIDETQPKEHNIMFKAWGISSMILLPCLVFYVTESFYHNPIMDIPVLVQLANCGLYITIGFILWFLIGNRVWAIRIVTIVGFIFGLGNYYLINFRGIPLLPWDILFVGTAASVMGEFDFMIRDNAILCSIASVVLFMVIGIYKKKSHIKLSYKSRCVLLPITIIVLCIQYFLLASAEYRERIEVYEALYAPYDMSSQNGLLVGFLLETQHMLVSKPEGYDATKVEGVLETFEADDTQELRTPNVIVIMSECFSDLSVLGAFDASEDEMPFVHEVLQGMENTVSGHMQVNVLAGNTANTEFEFLTGHTQAFLPDGSVTYQQYIEHDIDSLVSHMNTLGYTTVAMHPFLNTGWNRNHVFKHMQFDTFLDESDFENPTRVRAYIDDYSVTTKIIETMEQTSAPLFMFSVTMQNHSPYYTEYDNFMPNITVQGVDNFSLENYLSLMQISDDALSILIEQLSVLEEETVVVFFGDHQPADSVVEGIVSLDDIALDDRYKVPFIVWANYDIEEDTQVETSANFLSAQVYDWCDIPKSAYQNYLLELQKSYPVITTRGATTVQGVIEDLNKINRFKNMDDQLVQYQELQYNLMFE